MGGGAETTTLGEIVAQLGGELVGPPELTIRSVATLEAATPDAISFLANPLYARQLAASRAGCVVVGAAARDAATARGAAIVAADPYLYFARLTQWWAARRDGADAPAGTGVHPTAVVGDGARIAESATVGAFACLGDGVVVEAGAAIGAHAVVHAGVVVESRASIGPHAFVGRGCRVGPATRIGPRVALVRDTTLGARCIVHAGAVIGADGFGFAPDRAHGGRWEKIEQLGGVVVGCDVEIGANACIDRGALGDTEIGDGVKIDNLVQIGHNVRIGAHTAIAGCVGIAGSAVIGAGCMIGGGAGVNGHVTIADGVVITGATQVSRSIHEAGTYSGSYPFDDNRSWEKNAATLRNLHALRERVRALEKKSP